MLALQLPTVMIEEGGYAKETSRADAPHHLAQQKSIAATIQEQAIVDVPNIPLGQVPVPTVHRTELIA